MSAQPDRQDQPAARHLHLVDDDGHQALAAELLDLAGISQPATERLRRAVAAALANSWTAHDLRAKATKARDTRNPRSYLDRCLTNAAVEPPPTRPSSARPPDPPRGLLDDERTPCDLCGGCGMVGGLGPDGRPEPVTYCPGCHVLGGRP